MARTLTYYTYSQTFLCARINRHLNNMGWCFCCCLFIKKKKRAISQAWCHTSIISILGRLKKDNHKFEASLGYIMRPYVNKRQRNNSTSVINYLIFCSFQVSQISLQIKRLFYLYSLIKMYKNSIIPLLVDIQTDLIFFLATKK
jgi:hypothetical protein